MSNKKNEVKSFFHEFVTLRFLGKKTNLAIRIRDKKYGKQGLVIKSVSSNKLRQSQTDTAAIKVYLGACLDKLKDVLT